MAKGNQSSERRQHPRVDGNVPLKIYSDEFDLVTETKNLSRMGAYCQVNQYLEPMTKLKIHLLLNFKRNGQPVSKKISCNGIVVRIEPSDEKDIYNSAIYFHDIQSRDADVITEFINSVMDKT